MLYQVIEDGEITQSYSMPDHDDTHHLVTGGNRQEVHPTGIAVYYADENDYTILIDASIGNREVRLPAAASNTHRIYNIKKIDASGNTVTIDGNAGETIDGAATQVISIQYDSYTIHCDGTEWWII